MFADERYGKRIPSEREQRVIELVAQGLKNSEVADAIGTTEHVIKNYLRVIYDKLGLWNRVELALWYEARRHEEPVTEPTIGGAGLRPSNDRVRQRGVRPDDGDALVIDTKTRSSNKPRMSTYGNGPILVFFEPS